jgi:hypothetical protein
MRDHGSGAFPVRALDSRTSSSSVEDYEIYEFAKWCGFRGAKIAVIVGEGDRSYDFTDTVSNNAGYRRRLFTDEQEALRWPDENG